MFGSSWRLAPRASKQTSLLPNMRHRERMKLLTARGAVSTADAAKYFGVSTATVRRDMAQLDNGGRVLRVQGGAVSNSLRYLAG